MPVPPETVWAVLADPGDYARWVVGSKLIRDADAGWPAPGTRFHHTIGVGPVTLSDDTESLEARRPELLRVRAKARPLGTATVRLELQARNGGTRVRMTETPDGLAFVLALNPVAYVVTKLRNAESLKRLEALALRRPVA
jgi:uncharacterized protein YndB with AHSA1/START domain